MKAFIIALILLAMIGITIITNCLFISTLAEDILSLIEIRADIYIIEEKWKRSRALLMLSTDHDIIFKIDSLLERAVLFYEENNEYGYEHSLTLIRGAISELKSFEDFSLSNII